MPKVSVIIPALNEAAYLPALLDALRKQTRRRRKSSSPMRARPMARWSWCRRTVRESSPAGCAVGRNAGAQVAIGDLFLFFDADVLPPPDFLERALDEFTRGGYAVATCPIKALSDDPADRIVIEPHQPLHAGRETYLTPCGGLLHLRPPRDPSGPGRLRRIAQDVRGS